MINYEDKTFFIDWHLNYSIGGTGAELAEKEEKDLFQVKKEESRKCAATVVVKLSNYSDNYSEPSEENEVIFNGPSSSKSVKQKNLTQLLAFCRI